MPHANITNYALVKLLKERYEKYPWAFNIQFENDLNKGEFLTIHPEACSWNTNRRYRLLPLITPSVPLDYELPPYPDEMFNRAICLGFGRDIEFPEVTDSFAGWVFYTNPCTHVGGWTYGGNWTGAYEDMLYFIDALDPFVDKFLESNGFPMEHQHRWNEVKIPMIKNVMPKMPWDLLDDEEQGDYFSIHDVQFEICHDIPNGKWTLTGFEHAIEWAKEYGTHCVRLKKK